jgi:hypothetical protein
MTRLTADGFANFFRFYKGTPNQVSGVWTLFADLDKNYPAALEEESAWVKKFRTPEPAPPAPSHSNPLEVPWQSQNDNASGTGYRECFSSSCAMLAMYWGKVKNDDEYNKIRARYGDSTDPQAQLSALRSLGLTANYYTTGNKDKIKAEIDKGRPLAVGWLHHGSVSAPSGGGHWTCIRGYTDTATIQNDPNGEANLSAGGYTANTNGRNMTYSDKNWLPRWEADGSSTGWWLQCYL